MTTKCDLVFANSLVEAQWEIWLPHRSIDKIFLLAMTTINIISAVIVLPLPQAEGVKASSTQFIGLLARRCVSVFKWLERKKSSSQSLTRYK